MAAMFSFLAVQGLLPTLMYQLMSFIIQNHGFFIYGSALKVLGYNPLFDEIDLGGGYLYHLSKQFSGSVSYTRFFFNKDAAQIIKSASSNDINFKNTYRLEICKIKCYPGLSVWQGRTIFLLP